MNPFAVGLYVYIALLVFYILYIAAINIYRDWDTLSAWVQFVAFTPLVLMIILDTVMNFTIFTLLFLDVPEEMLVTQRLERYRKGADGWRKTAADKICTQALNPFDPTRQHC